MTVFVVFSSIERDRDASGKEDVQAGDDADVDESFDLKPAIALR